MKSRRSQHHLRGLMYIKPIIRTNGTQNKRRMNQTHKTLDNASASGYTKKAVQLCINTTDERCIRQPTPPGHKLVKETILLHM